MMSYSVFQFFFLFSLFRSLSLFVQFILCHCHFDKFSQFSINLMCHFLHDHYYLRPVDNSNRLLVSWQQPKSLRVRPKSRVFGFRFVYASIRDHVHCHLCSIVLLHSLANISVIALRRNSPSIVHF